MYETLLTNEECANAIDLGDFYRVPCDKRDLCVSYFLKVNIIYIILIVAVFGFARTLVKEGSKK